MQTCLDKKVIFAQSDDLEWIKAIADDHRRELGFVNRAALAVSIEDQEVLCLPHGFLHFHHRRDKISTLYHLCVARDRRQQGVGCQLIQAWEAESRKQGITTLRLKCPIDLEANGFYARVGFRRIEIEPGKRRSLVVWEKRLAAQSPQKPNFIASLSASGTEIEGLKRLWRKNQDFCPYDPFKQILYSPLASPSTTTAYLKGEKEQEKVAEVWIDCGAYQVQQGKLKYEDLLAFLEQFYLDNQWADRYVLPDVVPLSTDSDEVVEYKVRETIHHCCRFFEQMPAYIQARAIAPVQGRNLSQIYRCLESYAAMGIGHIGFGSWGTAGPNGSVNMLSVESLALFEKIYTFALEHHQSVHCFGIGGPNSYNRLCNNQLIPHTLDSTTWWKAGGFGSIFFPHTSQIQVTVRRGMETTRAGLEKLKQKTNHTCYFCQEIEKLRTSRNHRIMHNLAAWLETLERA